MPPEAVLVLGSNIAPQRHLPAALGEVLRWGRVAAVSMVYETPPAGGAVGPAFLNAALRLTTRHTPDALRTAARDLEARLGRVRTGDPNAARPMDVDVLLYRPEPTAPVQVVNPREWRYAHAVLPAAEVAPAWRIEGRTLAWWAGQHAAAARAFHPRAEVWAALMARLLPHP